MQSSSSHNSFSNTARSLTSPISPGPESPDTPKRPSWPRSPSDSARAPLWSRDASISSVIGSSRAALRRYSSSSGSHQEQPWHTAIIRTGINTVRGSWRLFQRLTPIQKAAVVAFVVVTHILMVLALIYHNEIYHWLAPFSEKVRNHPFGWVVLWFFTFLSAFPPMMGYSTCVTLAGFIYGMKGWFIAASANIVGSTTSFIVCRRYLASWSQRLAARDTRIAAFTLVIQRDGLPLLCAIRWCPLPYALSNCGLSTIQSIQPIPFAIATASAAPKLLLHVFVGDRLAVIARGTSGEQTMDAGAKAANYAGIVAGIFVGGTTGWVIYRRTVARARQLEAEEGSHLDDEPEGSIRANGRLRGDRKNTSDGADIALTAGLEHPDGFADEVFADDDGDQDEEDGWMPGANGRSYSDASTGSGSRRSQRSGDSESNVGFNPSGRRW